MSVSFLLVAAVVAASPADSARVPLPSDAEAWAALPKTTAGGVSPLPAWARALARPLPQTTAALLKLDRLHRTGDRIDPLLRGRMRWVAADANRSAYGRACAEADLRRAGLDAKLPVDEKSLPERERRALDFARRMTVDAGAVTDEDVANLREAYGDAGLTAMILLLAHANFQDRLLTSLNIPVEPGGPPPPLDVAFDPEAEAPSAPERKMPATEPVPAPPLRVDDEDWRALSFDALRAGLKDQRERPGRVPIPTMQEVVRRQPKFTAGRADIPSAWGRVCMMHQPELSLGWSEVMRAFRAESKLDLVFQDSLFWVVTRTIHCFY